MINTMRIKKPALQLWIKLQFNNTGFTDDKTVIIFQQELWPEEE